MIAILHNIRSVHNVGSIFRTSDAAGVKKLYLCGITPAPVDHYGRKREALTKVSLGAEHDVGWESASSTVDTILSLKKDGYTICALEQSRSSVSLWSYSASADMLDHLAIVIGNEVDGLSQDILDICDMCIEISMLGKKESLNVGVAYGICVYRFVYLQDIAMMNII